MTTASSGTSAWPGVQAQFWNLSGVREAKAFGNACLQPAPRTSSAGLPVPLSEDCLYLNVWTPTKRGDAPLPVPAPGPLPTVWPALDGSSTKTL